MKGKSISVLPNFPSCSETLDHVPRSPIEELSYSPSGETIMITTHVGKPHPLGPTVIHSSPTHVSINLAIFSHRSLTIFIFPPRQSSETLLRQPVTSFPVSNRTGNIYHVAIHNLPYHAAYAVHPQGADRLVHDPYAKFLECRSVDEWMTLPEVPRQNPNPFREFRRRLSTFPAFQKNHICQPFILSLFTAPEDLKTFDFCNVIRPHVPHEQTVIYEAHVRALTPNGTFESAVAVIPYLKWLGITTIQLLPVFEFDELETSVSDGIHKPNMWGYSPVSWFMPMGRYSSGSAALGLKKFVRELHRAGIECVLDVVYNHSGHGSCPLHFLGVQYAYYMGRRVGEHFHHSNISGCGNTLSPNSPVMSDLIMESLRWFVAEYHVDGFRIDAAGVLCRDPNGKPTCGSVILDRIAADPLLCDIKIIVEGWDAGDQIESPNMLLGRFPRGEAVSEWNPHWRDVVRKFWRGDGDDQEFREALRGSPHLFENNRPHGACHGVNFVACHDGFCLADVVSYTKRLNSDGFDEVSFNCGGEGKTIDAQINARRAKQMRNMILTLAVSRGIPMILQGDEMGFSKEGYSNTWNDPGRYACVLPERPQETTDHDSLVQFTQYLLKMRRNFSQLSGMDFHRNVTWVGIDGEPITTEKEGNSEHKCVSFITGANEIGERLLVAFNGSTDDIKFRLPLEEIAWRPLVDTATAKWRGDSLRKTEGLTSVTISCQSSVIYVGRSATKQEKITPASQVMTNYKLKR